MFSIDRQCLSNHLIHIIVSRVAGWGNRDRRRRNFPDPAVIRGADGSYYVYATQASVDGAMHNIQVARSNDLLSWLQIVDALPEKPRWASATQDFLCDLTRFGLLGFGEHRAR